MSVAQNRTIPVAVGRSKADSATPGGGAGRTDEAVPVALEQPINTPLIDIHEGPEGLILEADLPGVSENNLNVQLEDNVLTLHAKVTSPFPEGARVLHEEYRVSDFYRSFILSDEVERNKISAELRNGVLRLSLPKAERARTRRIEIRS
jgi:HSP20 family molecular chaperone IbpA